MRTRTGCDLGPEVNYCKSRTQLVLRVVSESYYLNRKGSRGVFSPVSITTHCCCCCGGGGADVGMLLVYSGRFPKIKKKFTAPCHHHDVWPNQLS